MSRGLDQYKGLSAFSDELWIVVVSVRQGYRPTAAQVKAAFAIIDKLKGEAEEDMSKIEALETQVKELAEVVAGLTKSKDALKGQTLQQAAEIKALKYKTSIDEPPAWAQPAIKAAVEAGLLDAPSNGSYDFYRTLTVLHRAGQLITIHEGDK